MWLSSTLPPLNSVGSRPMRITEAMDATVWLTVVWSLAAAQWQHAWLIMLAASASLSKCGMMTPGAT